jgi:phosphohistidine phosphatase
MDLILWRHAEAEDFAIGGDAKRALTRRGLKQAQKMAQWLNARLPDHCRILASPATRTQQTATALDRPFDTLPALAVGASVEDVLQAAGWPGAQGCVLVIGHQPTLGLVGSRLLHASDDGMSLRKGAILWVEDRAGSGRHNVLHAALTPELV